MAVRATPLERDPEAVLSDVLNGYVTFESAKRDYGVAIRCHKQSDEQIFMPEHFELDAEAMANLRAPSPPGRGVG